MCYPQDESNNLLQMKTTFKKINPRNKLGVSTHSHYDYKSTNYNNYEKPQHSREDYKTSLLLGKTKIICYICKRKATKLFNVKTEGKKIFCQNIRTDSKGQTYFLTLVYDIVSDKSNLLVDCSATEHVIINKSKFINFDQNFEPGQHFVELADGSQANNIVLKRDCAYIYLCNSK